MNPTSSAISYHRLTPAARGAIRSYGLTIAAYVRAAGWEDGDWHGDECGCRDDRCIGFHHDAHEECGCLPALIEEQLGWSFVPSHVSVTAAAGMRTYPDGACLGSYRSTPEGKCQQCGWSPPARRDESGTP